MRYITAIEAAGVLGISTARIRRLALDGILKGEKAGPVWLFLPADVEKLKGRKTGRPPKATGMKGGAK